MMKKDEWESWRTTIWGKEIKRNNTVRVKRSAGSGVKTNIGRVLSASDEYLIIRLFGDPLGIPYKRLKSVEKL